MEDSTYVLLEKILPDNPCGSRGMGAACCGGGVREKITCQFVEQIG